MYHIETSSEAMWGDEPQLQSFRERLKLLLVAHQQELNPKTVLAVEGDVLFHQGDSVKTLMLLTRGRVALDIHHNNEVHTLAEVEAMELLGEVGFFADGKHYTDFRVVNGTAELLAIPGDALLQAMLFDTDLVVEMLSLVSERCRRGNKVIAMLLSGIEAVHHDAQDRVKQTTAELGGIHFCVAKASKQLEQLHQQRQH
jgi:CRP-like cAMP-binding protein|tara:strand:+ start:319 stop:915 length:597 start_codon:yes stop_codon:yes gene_type:complete